MAVLCSPKVELSLQKLTEAGGNSIVKSTDHSLHPKLPHSFTPGLKLPFSRNPSYHILFFSPSALTPRRPRTPRFVYGLLLRIYVT